MITINNPDDALAVIRPMIKHPLQEELFIVCVDNHNQMLSINLFGLGDEKSVIFPIKHIAKEAIHNIASAIIVAHTHPSNCVMPSKSDMERTNDLREAMKLFDISVMDHIIIGKDKYFSISSETEHKF